MYDTRQTMDWSRFDGSDPGAFTPYDTAPLVSDLGDLTHGDGASWPEGSGPGLGKVVVAGSDDLSAYDPYDDILVFGFRDPDHGVREMGADDHSVLFEEVTDGLWDLKVMALDQAEPIAVISGLIQDDMPQYVQSWVSTDDRFQDDLTTAVFAVDRGAELPAHHMAVFTHEQDAITRHDYAALKAEHGDDVVLNFVTMVGRELRVRYDDEDQSLRIDHFVADRPEFVDMWGSTLIENIAIEELQMLVQLWRRDVAREDSAVLRDRFQALLEDLARDDGAQTQAPEPDLAELPVATFVVELDEPFDTVVELPYWTEDITAVAGQDYVPASGTLIFAPGETAQEVKVSLRSERVAYDTFRLLIDGGADGPVEVVSSLRDDTAVALDNSFEMPVAEFKVRTDWGDGAMVELVLTNTTGRDIEGWEIDFDLAVGISEYWSAKIFGDGNARYTAENLGSNGRVPAGEAVVIGFNTMTGRLDEDQLNQQADFTFDFI
ncbi:cellulose binding domain-containing protein [Actibacterium sp. 188UL27-1]|uniref:cellulose binding domain-containing protein n=1 Tax=Actibacterium sp. 188UL27-1 TaxID=2786961 RepID=UPI001956D8A7|nr:cellulose binding domain-containing protein [Actibacterium sp. 188UL27-1]MBM7066623.1 cellulose binding domain-containing protein [Actibacterium sp. 188UL27-1]